MIPGDSTTADGKGHRAKITFKMDGSGWQDDERRWPALQDDMIDAMSQLTNTLRMYLE